MSAGLPRHTERPFRRCFLFEQRLKATRPCFALDTAAALQPRTVYFGDSEARALARYKATSEAIALYDSTCRIFKGLGWHSCQLTPKSSCQSPRVVAEELDRKAVESTG